VSGYEHLAVLAEESLTQASQVNPSLDGWQSQLPVWSLGVPNYPSIHKAWT